MKFSDSFRIYFLRNKTISLEQAIDTARKNNVDFAYDPIDIYGPDSWYWCAGILDVLQQEGFIHGYDVLREAPKVQRDIAKPRRGVIH